MKVNKEKLVSLLKDAACVLIFTAPLLLFYMFANEMRWAWVFWLYFALTAVVGCAYFLYNRGFAHTRVSRNGLPATWSEEEKDKFFDENTARAKRSKPLLYLFIALCLCFFYDMVTLFLWDSLVATFPFLGKL